MRACEWSSIAVTLVLATAQSLAQAPAPTTRMAEDAHPSFAVAAIRPHDPDSREDGMGLHADGANMRNQTLARLIMFTYSIHPRQIVDAPAWVDDLHYDIDGRFDTPGSANLKQTQEMLQKLLADRFQLKFHMEKRELPAYAIRVAKGGPKLKPATPEDHLDQTGWGNATDRTVVFTDAAMPNLILGMQFFLDRPLVDQTGLEGRYDFTIHYAEDEANAAPNAPPGIFIAVQEQLGLKFEPTKALVDVFLIDRAEQPSPN